MRKLILVLVCFLGIFFNARESKGLELCLEGCCWVNGDIAAYNACSISSGLKRTTKSSAGESKELVCLEGCCWANGDLVAYNACSMSSALKRITKLSMGELYFEGCIVNDEMETACCWGFSMFESELLKEETCQEIIALKAFSGLIILP